LAASLSSLLLHVAGVDAARDPRYGSADIALPQEDEELVAAVVTGKIPSNLLENKRGARQGYVARPCGGSSGDRSRDYTSILGEIDPYILRLWRQSCQYFRVLVTASWSVWPFEQRTNEAADHTLPWLSVWLLLLLHSDLLHGNILV
jgi:hypothetical protein